MLAILTTHPIQYQVPIWRELAKAGDVPFKVFFMSDQGLKPRFDPGFGRDVAWDIDLLSGYPHAFIDVHRGSRQAGFGWLRLKPGFGRLLREQGVTVLWVQGWQVMAYWQAIFQASRAGVRVWLRGDTNRRSNAGGMRQGVKRLLLRRLLDRVDCFLTVGVANAGFYRWLGYPEARMETAPHCVENRRFRESADAQRGSRAALRAAWGIPADAFCLLAVGKFDAKKRPQDLAEAVRRLQGKQPLRKLHLLWVGTGTLEPQLRGACTVAYDVESGLRVSVEAAGKPLASFAGFLNQSQISRAYVAADALVLASDAKETWGLVVNEAMASGLPCVVSNAAGCVEDLVLPLRPDLCFPVGDIDALVGSLESLIDWPPAPVQLRKHIDAYDPARTVETVRRLVGADPMQAAS